MEMKKALQLLMGLDRTRLRSKRRRPRNLTSQCSASKRNFFGPWTWAASHTTSTAVWLQRRQQQTRQTARPPASPSNSPSNTLPGRGPTPGGQGRLRGAARRPPPQHTTGQTEEVLPPWQQQAHVRQPGRARAGHPAARYSATQFTKRSGAAMGSAASATWGIKVGCGCQGDPHAKPNRGCRRNSHRGGTVVQREGTS